MRAIYTAALAVAFLGLLQSGLARAASSYSLFDSDCLATHGDRKAALAIADAAGWQTLDPSMVPIPAQQGFKLTDYAVRLQIDGQNFKVLVVGMGEATVDPSQPPHPADICIIMAKPGESDGTSKAAAWAAVTPIPQGNPNASLFVFEETADGHKLLTKGEGARAALDSGRISMIVAGSPSPDLSVLGYLHLKP